MNLSQRNQISTAFPQAQIGIQRPFELHDVILEGELAAEEGVASGTPMVLFVVIAEQGFTSKKGNKYAKGTYWFAPKVQAN